MPLGQGMMACKGWKGGAIKIQKKSKIEYYRKKSKNEMQYEAIKSTFGSGYDGL